MLQQNASLAISAEKEHGVIRLLPCVPYRWPASVLTNLKSSTSVVSDMLEFIKY